MNGSGADDLKGSIPAGGIGVREPGKRICPMSKALYYAYGLALFIGTSTVLAVPTALHAQEKIVCERCVCNIQTGWCECTGCRVVPT